MWFCAHSILEKEEVQKNGVVALGIPWKPGDESKADSKTVRFVFRDIGILPIRIQAFHQVWENQTSKIMVDTTLFAMGPRIRARYRKHQIRVCDFAKELEAYGFREEILPVDLGGTSEFHYESWLQAQRALSFET